MSNYEGDIRRKDGKPLTWDTDMKHCDVYFQGEWRDFTKLNNTVFIVKENNNNDNT